MKIKSIAARIKAVGTDDDLGLGQFSAYASIFGNVDSYGDIVEKGAFANTLDEWQKSGAPIPVYWSHLMGGDPTMNLGHVLTAEEDEKGLLVTAQLDVEANEKAAYTYRLLKGRRVQQMSFAYDVIDSVDHEDSFGADLKELKLHEVSVVPLGANAETEILEVKRAITSLKAGRTISAKNEQTLRSALESLSGASAAITDVLSILDSANEDDQGKASETRPVKSDGRNSVKLDGPSAISTVDTWTAALLMNSF